MQRRRTELDAHVAASHAASDGVYGAPRVLADLRADGRRVSRKTVAASLRRQRLAGICPRRFAPATTVVDLDAPMPTDLVRRRFDSGAVDRVWTSDITYLRTGQGWLYLCAVLRTFLVTMSWRVSGGQVSGRRGVFVPAGQWCGRRGW